MLPPATDIVAAAARYGVRVRGLVQGVGFRPMLYQLAQRYGVSGWVANDGDGVLAELQASRVALDALLAALPSACPPLGRIDGIAVTELPPQPDCIGFTIRPSLPGPVLTAIGPDAAVCPACLEELFTPTDRRWRYPFLNCTHCGPRYTITRALPYDRPNTAMAAFPLCPDCTREYHDPQDRRFHAQPLACPVCGPALSHSVADCLAALRAGKIIALKGLGGFHLVCDARNAAAVALLRQRKQRDGKPFAVMMAGLASVAQECACPPEAAELLTSPERPVVLLPRLSRQDGAEGTLPPLAGGLAPGLPWLGVLLPYTPLHYLLFHDAAGRPSGTGWLNQPQSLALVMTSANPGGEPLVIGNAEAEQRLSGLADLIVTHNRDILIRADDSVIRPGPAGPLLIRRARGYVPRPVRLPLAVPPTLAVGGHLKTTFCLLRGRDAFVSQHLGDLDSPAGVAFFQETLTHLQSVLRITPERVVHDRHPDFFTTRFAHALGLPALAVQHHHAHLAAVLAEQPHLPEEPVLGLALDGFGLGEDGTAWGGELLRLDNAGQEMTRLGHLLPLAQPGGDRAAREPWRSAAALLQQLGVAPDEIASFFASQPLAGSVAHLLHSPAAARLCPPTSSCGRLFDAAAALLGICLINRHESDAALQLEGLADAPQTLAGGWQIDGQNRLDLRPVLAELARLGRLDQQTRASGARDMAVTGRSRWQRTGAGLFHGTLAAALADWTVRSARRDGLRTVLLGGGCFLNQTLSAALCQALQAAGLTPLLPRQMPPNDGGLSLGQGWIGGLRGQG